MFKVTLKGLFQHKIRFLLTTMAVVAGVSFVVGAFTLTDSVSEEFSSLFEDLNAGIDLTVRGESQVADNPFAPSPPIDEALVDVVAGTDGVRIANPSVGGAPAFLLDGDGEAMVPLGGAPPLGVSTDGDSSVSGVFVDQGRLPEGGGEVAVDVDTAERARVQAGEVVQVQTPLGLDEYDLVGTFSFGESNALAGATLVGFTLPEAQRLFNLEGQVQSIAVSLEEGSDLAAVQAGLAAQLPDGVEVISTDEIVAESTDQLGAFLDIFRAVLLAFAIISLVVSAFLIANTFTIVVSQRVRELALLRAIGASGAQVFRSVLGEALLVGVLASIIGSFGGILVALVLQFLLGAGGFGSGETALVINGSSFLWALVVGIGVTVLFALLPALRATRIPPVAAMQEGFTLTGTSVKVRTIAGVVLLMLGALFGGQALFGGAEGQALLAGMIAGAGFLVLGVAFVSPVLARPLSAGLGRPFRLIWGETGHLAGENAARNPKRTASTASALMVGLALVSMAFIVGESIKGTIGDIVDGEISADWYADAGGFVPFPAQAADEVGELPEVGVATSGRFTTVEVAGQTEQINAVDLAVLPELFTIDVIDGDPTAGEDAVLVDADTADRLDVGVGDTVTTTFNETGPQPLEVAAVYDSSQVLGSFIIDISTLEANTSDRSDFWMAATTAEGVDQEVARTAIAAVLDDYAQVTLQDRDEFRDSQEGQIDVLLVVINVFLLFAVFIAFIGILNTLALSVFERTRELGLLRAVGMRRGQVGVMVMLESVIVALFGGLLGLVLGAVFGVSISLALPDDVVTAVAVPWGSLVAVLVVAGVLGVLASVWPAWRAARLDVLDAIASE